MKRRDLLRSCGVGLIEDAHNTSWWQPVWTMYREAPLLVSRMIQYEILLHPFCGKPTPTVLETASNGTCISFRPMCLS